MTFLPPAGSGARMLITFGATVVLLLAEALVAVILVRGIWFALTSPGLIRL